LTCAKFSKFNVKTLKPMILKAIVFLCIERVLGDTSNLLKVFSVQPWPTSVGNVNNSADNLLNTQWVSNPCRSGAWRSNPVFNLLYGSCATGSCTGSCNTDLSSATDGSPYTAGSAPLSHAEGRSWINFPFRSGEALKVASIYIRGAWPMDTELFVTTPNGDVKIATLSPQQNYLDLAFPAPTFPISGLKVQSITKDGVMRGYCYAGIGDCKTLSVTEVAVQTEDCYEQLVMDLGGNKVITNINVKFNGYTGGMISTSLDNMNFVDRIDLSVVPVSYFLPQNVAVADVTARYVRFRLIN
jgi:hypothetical protein